MVSMSRSGNHNRSSLQFPIGLPGGISSPTSGCAHTAFDAWIPSSFVLGNWLLTRSCWFSRAKAPHLLLLREGAASPLAPVGWAPSRGIPSSRSARITQLRIVCPDGPNALASGSGLLPARTNSTICCRNSGGQGEWGFGTVGHPPSLFKELNVHEMSTKSGQLQADVIRKSGVRAVLQVRLEFGEPVFSSRHSPPLLPSVFGPVSTSCGSPTARIPGSWRLPRDSATWKVTVFFA